MWLFEYTELSLSESISLRVFVKCRITAQYLYTARAFLWKYSQFSPSPSISIILFVMQVQHWEGRLKRKIEKKDWSILHITSISLKILTIFTISVHLHHSFCYASATLRRKIEKEDWEKRLKYIAGLKIEGRLNFLIHCCNWGATKNKVYWHWSLWWWGMYVTEEENQQGRRDLKKTSKKRKKRNE